MTFYKEFNSMPI